MHEVALVLEDDVDMERDIQDRLENLIDKLPIQWDMLFLGEALSIFTETYRHRLHVASQDTVGRTRASTERSQPIRTHLSIHHTLLSARMRMPSHVLAL